MLLREIRDLLAAEVLSCEHELDREIASVHASDLISEVLASCCRGALWVTGLLDRQIVNTAELFDLSGVIFVSNRRPSSLIVEAANEDNIPVLVTKFTMFECCGILYKNGLTPGRR